MLAKLEQLKSTYDNKVRVMMKHVADLLCAQSHCPYNITPNQETENLAEAVKKTLKQYLDI